MGELRTKPVATNYRAILERGRAQHSSTDEEGLIDEDPLPDRRGGLNSSHRRTARATLAQVIRDKAPPEDLVNIVLAIAKDKEEKAEIRIIAVKTLWDRAYGRPAQLHQVETTISSQRLNDHADDALRRMSDEELIDMIELADKVKGKIAELEQGRELPH